MRKIPNFTVGCSCCGHPLPLSSLSNPDKHIAAIFSTCFLLAVAEVGWFGEGVMPWRRRRRCVAPAMACFASLLLSSEQQLGRRLWDGGRALLRRRYVTHSLSRSQLSLPNFPLPDLLEKRIGNAPLCYILLSAFFFFALRSRSKTYFDPTHGFTHPWYIFTQPFI